MVSEIVKYNHANTLPQLQLQQRAQTATYRMSAVMTAHCKQKTKVQIKSHILHVKVEADTEQASIKAN